MFENPFFRRELRALARRGFGPIVWPLLVQNLLLFIPFSILERVAAGRLHPADAWQGFALVGMGLAHAAPLGAVGWILGARVFGVEHRLRTLEGLRLVATHPGVWLLQKLVFPVGALLLVWGAAYPIYAAMIVRGHFVPRELWPGMLLAGCVGLLVFGSALLSPPEGLRSPIRDGIRVSRSVRRQDAILLALPLWISFVILRLALDWMSYALDVTQHPFPVLPFFRDYLATDLALGLLMGGFALTAGTAAYATAHPADPSAPHIRTGGRVAGVVTALVLFIGYSVSFPMANLLQAGACLAAVMVAIPPGNRPEAQPKRRRQVEDPLGGWELSLLCPLIGNAVAVRDLRATLRTASLTRNLLVYGLIIAMGSVLLGDFAFPILSMTGAVKVDVDPFWGRVGAGALLVGSWFILPATLAFGGRSLGAWGTDRRCSTLSQVFATPLPTAAFVRGRWAAALIVGVVRAIPVPISFLVGMAILQGAGDLQLALSNGLWLTTLGLILSAGLAGSAQNTIELKDLLCSGCLAVYTVMVEGAMFMWEWTQVEIVNGVPDRTPMGSFCMMLVPLNLLITYLVYRVAVRDIDLLRRRELELA